MYKGKHYKKSKVEIYWNRIVDYLCDKFVKIIDKLDQFLEELGQNIKF